MGAAVRVVAAIVFLTLMPRISAATPMIPERLVVRVYDSAGVAPGDRVRAIKSAHEILAGLDIDVAWHECDERVGALRKARLPAPQAFHAEAFGRLDGVIVFVSQIHPSRSSL